MLTYALMIAHSGGAARAMGVSLTSVSLINTIVQCKFSDVYDGGRSVLTYNDGDNVESKQMIG